MKKTTLFFSLILLITLSACKNTDPTLMPTAPSPATPTAVVAAATDTPALPAPLPTATTAAPTPTPRTFSFRTVGIIGRLDTLNPLLDLNPALAKISPLLYPSLNRRNAGTGLPQPFAAELPTIAVDNLTLTFTLKLTDITPADVQASIETAILPELDDVRTVEIVNSRTVRITLTEPNCTTVDALSTLPLLPQTQIEGDNPTGVMWDTASQTLTLLDTSGAATLTLRFFPNSTAAQAALSTGEIDAIEAPSLITPTPRLIFAPFNNLQPPFDDPAVRRALSLAVDRASLAQNYFGGTVATSILPANGENTAPAFDPNAARHALDAAGITDRDGDGWRELPGESQAWQVSIEMDVNREDLQPVAFWLAEYYRRIGVLARVETISFSFLIDDLLTRDYQMAIYDWRVDVSAVRARWHSNSIDAEFGQNITGYRNLQMDTLIDALDTVPGCDASARAKILRDIARILADDRPGDFLSFIF